MKKILSQSYCEYTNDRKRIILEEKINEIKHLLPEEPLFKRRKCASHTLNTDYDTLFTSFVENKLPLLKQPENEQDLPSNLKDLDSETLIELFLSKNIEFDILKDSLTLKKDYEEEDSPPLFIAYDSENLDLFKRLLTIDGQIGVENICGDNISHYLASALPDSEKYIQCLLENKINFEFFKSENGDNLSAIDIIKNRIKLNKFTLFD